MDELRTEIGISCFGELEWAVKRELDRAFALALSRVLEALDEWLFHRRNARRYKSHEIRERTVHTVLGIEVSFRRRYYYDEDEGSYVALLDKLLDLPGREQLSPGLRQVAVHLGVSGPSYRAAAGQLQQCHGHRVMSHEAIRQAVIRAGRQVADEQKREREHPEGTQRVKVLWIEADGGYIRLQRSKRRRVEKKLAVSHEGWRRRHPRSSEYELVNPRVFCAADAEDFWEEASRDLMRTYDLDRTVVVINGDRASWIRQGVKAFPQAIYQVDRFHLKRELKQWFGRYKPLLAELYRALDSEDVTGATFLACLSECQAKLKTRKEQEAAKALLEDLASIPEAVVDYRWRLAKLYGIDTTGMRGMGAAEAQIDRFTDRLRGRGQAWSLRGLQAIAELICKRMEGRLGQVLERLGWLNDEVGKPVLDGMVCAYQTAERVLKDTCGLSPAHPRVMDAGRVGSGGMSRLMHRIANGVSL